MEAVKKKDKAIPYVEYDWPHKAREEKFYKANLCIIWFVVASLIYSLIGLLFDLHVNEITGKVFLAIVMLTGISSIIFSLLKVLEHFAGSAFLRERFEKAYDLEITDEEFSDLKYPFKKTPGKEPQTYGSFTRTSTNSKGEVGTSVYLLRSENSLMQLVKVQGTP